MRSVPTHHPRPRRGATPARSNAGVKHPWARQEGARSLVPPLPRSRGKAGAGLSKPRRPPPPLTFTSTPALSMVRANTTLGEPPMLTRRTVLAASVASPFVATAGKSQAATPKDVAVMAKEISDIIAFDPAEILRVQRQRSRRKHLSPPGRPRQHRPQQGRRRRRAVLDRQPRRHHHHLQAQEQRLFPVRQGADRRRRRLLAPARREAEQDAGLHRHPVRLHQGQRGASSSAPPTRIRWR